MSIHQQVYANTDPIYFKLTKNGDRVLSQTLSTGDVFLSIDGGAWADISSECTEMVGAGLGKGWYVWQPTGGGQTSGKVLIINIDENAGTNFDENSVVIVTGGNALARHSG